MKKVSGAFVFERSLLVVMALLVVLVCVTGSLVYTRLSSIIENDEVPGENKVSRRTIVSDLNNNLLKADNLTYTFLFEGNDIAQYQFRGLKGRTFDKLAGLKRFRTTDKPYQKQVDELQMLFDQRFDNQEALMAIQNENRVDETMEMVVDEVSNTRAKVNVETPTTPAAEEKKRLFKRKKDKAPEKPAVNPLLIAEQNRQQINSKLRSVQEKVVSKEDYDNALKLDLEQENTLLAKKINELFRSIALADKQDLERETMKAKSAARETNRIIILFLIISFLLIATIGWLMMTIFRKTRSTNDYLRAAKEKSDQLTEVKSRFLATMSHEIRTPLNAISGFSDQLYYEKLPDPIHHKIDIIRASAQHLAQITNEVLDLSRLERDHVQLESTPFNIRKEIIAVQEQFGFQLGERNNTLALDGELKDWILIGDPLRFRQMLINLISNANKFSQNSTITVHFSAKLKDSALHIALAVEDEGIGIDKKKLATIFEPFEQADGSVARKYGGTGLGLSITKLIVEKMGGKITVKSTMNKGTTFKLTFALPLSEENLRMEEETREDFSFLTGKTVLLVDDEPFNRLLLKAIFEGVEMTLLEAGNGVEAFELIKSSAVDVVLLDVHMPEMDGNELVAHIVDSKHDDNLIVVGLTASLDDATRKKMLLEGWTEVLTKPMKPEELREILYRLTTTQEQEAMGQVNFEGLKKLSNNNKGIYRDLLETFVTSTNNGREALNALMEAESWKQIGEKAHQLAAPFKHFEAMHCYTTLKEIEKLGKNESETEKIPELVNVFLEDSEDVLEQIKTEINTL